MLKEELPLQPKPDEQVYENIPIICERCFHLKYYG